MRTIKALAWATIFTFCMCMIVKAAEPYDGEWAGTTDQGYDVRFTVSDNTVTSFKIKYQVQGDFCSFETERTITGEPGEPIFWDTFSFMSSEWSLDEYEFEGTFLNSSSCNGTWYTYDNYCKGSGSGTWSAFKIQLPDGSFDMYFDTVQNVYIGYYQRPADPSGLLYWAQRLYMTNGDLDEIIEAFANSEESQILYGTINSSNIAIVVDSIYMALFNRPAETEGKAYYVNGFNAGRFTAATIMLNVLYGAQNQDLFSVNNKVAASNIFTRTIDPELDGYDFQVTYAGNSDVIAGRNFLGFVTWNSSTVPTQDETTLYIQRYIADPNDPIMTGFSEGNQPKECADIDGNWNYTTSGSITWCADGECETENVSDTGIITINQNGCTISWVNPVINELRSGIVSANEFQVSGVFAVPLVSGVNITQNLYSASGTISYDNNRIDLYGSGIATGTYEGMSFSITGEDVSVFTRSR
jgi:hypothetical protein